MIAKKSETPLKRDVLESGNVVKKKIENQNK